MAIIKSVSLDEEEDNFIKEYNLSPTRLLKEKIWEMKGMIKTVVQKKLAKQAEVISRLYQRIDELENVLSKEKVDGGEE